MDWSIYYDDGSIWSSENGSVEETPGLGVVAVLLKPEGSPMIVVGHDFYCWHEDQQRWWGADQSGVWDYLHRPGWKKVLFGRTVSNEQYGRIHAQAMRDAGMIVGGET